MWNLGVHLGSRARVIRNSRPALATKWVQAAGGYKRAACVFCVKEEMEKEVSVSLHLEITVF